MRSAADMSFLAPFQGLVASPRDPRAYALGLTICRRFAAGNLGRRECVMQGDAGREVETSYRNRPLLSPRRQGELFMHGYSLLVLIFCLQEVNSIASHAIHQAVFLSNAARPTSREHIF